MRVARICLTFCVAMLGAVLLLKKSTPRLVERGSAAIDDRLESSFQSWMRGDAAPIVASRDEASEEGGASWGPADKLRSQFFHARSMVRQFVSVDRISHSHEPPVPRPPAIMAAPDATAGAASYPVHALFDMIESSVCTKQNRRMPRPNENISPSYLDARGRMSHEPTGAPVRGTPAELIPFQDCQLYTYDIIPDVMAAHHQVHLSGPLDEKKGWKKEELLIIRSEQYDRDDMTWFFQFDVSGRMRRSMKVHLIFGPTEKQNVQNTVTMSSREARGFVAKEWDYWQDFARGAQGDKRVPPPGGR